MAPATSPNTQDLGETPLILDPSTTTLADLRTYRRFNVVGTTGSGKSTFAQSLATELGLPYVEMDQLFWKPHWTESSDQEFFPKIADAVAEEEWVLDGNYSRTTPIKWPRTELVIWLDMPFATTLYRVSKRAIERSMSGRELWPDTNNRETFRKLFSSDSIVLWCLKGYGTNRRRYQRLMAEGGTDAPHFLHLTTKTQVARLAQQTSDSSRKVT